MKAKRKPTYEQALALQRGQQTARANQRARAAARAAETEPKHEPKHEHRYGDWTCVAVANGYEKRYCECGAFETRPFSL